MVKRGIHQTTAAYWVHLFPAEYALYWYAVRDMKAHLKKKNPVSMIGNSKDGTPTGKGYLVKKSEPFIGKTSIPKNMVDYFDWKNGTDRQVGANWGETIVAWCLSLAILRLPIWSSSKIRDRAKQVHGGDFQMSFCPNPTIEIKTENLSSSNIFVQTEELNHNVNVYRTANGEIKKRHVQID